MLERIELGAELSEAAGRSRCGPALPSEVGPHEAEGRPASSGWPAGSPRLSGPTTASWRAVSRSWPTASSAPRATWTSSPASLCRKPARASRQRPRHSSPERRPPRGRIRCLKGECDGHAVRRSSAARATFTGRRRRASKAGARARCASFPWATCWLSSSRRRARRTSWTPPSWSCCTRRPRRGRGSWRRRTGCSTASSTGSRPAHRAQAAGEPSAKAAVEEAARAAPSDGG